MLNKEEQILLELLLKKYGETPTPTPIVNLPIKTRKNLSKAQRGWKHWTLEELHQLATMSAKGISTVTIARTLRRSKASVRTMATNMFNPNLFYRTPLIRTFWQQYNTNGDFVGLLRESKKQTI